MTIDEAIQQLHKLKRYAYEPETEKAITALQLGIEALIRIQKSRGDASRYYIGYLPGETKE